MDVALISDTHIPSRASQIPGPFRERIERADHVIHAGDFDSEGALANIREMATELTAVAGNIDPQVGLPEVATVECGGVEFVVTHGTGSRRDYEQRVAGIVTDTATSDEPVGVAGHTHELLDTRVEGVRMLNPGSVTGASPASETSMMIGTVEDGHLDVDVETI